MLLDVVHWQNTTGCSRCAGHAERYIPPYWETNKRLCHKCCCELARIYDEHGWPPMVSP